MDELSEVAAQVWAFAEHPPTRESRAAVIRALRHKREGIQSIAAQVLGAWGGRESVDALHQWLLDCEHREYGWAVRGVAVSQLAQIVESRDAGWILDLYFAVPSSLSKHELLPLVRALSPDVARERLVSALRDNDWQNRQAAVKAIGRMTFPDRRQLLLSLADDPNPNVQKSARLLSGEA